MPDNKEPGVLFGRRKYITNDATYDFTLVSYNILADCHIPPLPRERTGIYALCDDEDLYTKADTKASRHLLLMKEIKYLSSDVLCIQEVEDDYYPVLKAELDALGYQSYYEQKVLGTREGVMTSYQPEKFQLISKQRIVVNDLMYEKAASLNPQCSEETLRNLERDSVAIVVHMKHLLTGKEIVICNFHAIYDVEHPDICTLHVCLLSQMLFDLRNNLLRNGLCALDIPVIFCGDFNTEPWHLGHKLMINGRFSSEEADLFGKTYYEINPRTQATDEKIRPESDTCASSVFKNAFLIPLKFLSAYCEVLGHEPEVTSGDGVHCSTFDYIFHTPELTAVGILSPFTKEQLLPGGPSRIFPSDHTSLKAEFRFPENT